MTIKRINAGEMDLVTGLFDRYRTFYKQTSDIKSAALFISERLSKKESVIFAALEKDHDKMIPVGFTQLYPAYSSVRLTKNWILNDLYVEPDYRRQGIGEQLIRAAMQFAKESGAGYVQLETAVDNYSAQHLYESIGFKKRMPDDDFFVYRISLDERRM